MLDKDAETGMIDFSETGGDRHRPGGLILDFCVSLRRPLLCSGPAVSHDL